MYLLQFLPILSLLVLGISGNANSDFRNRVQNDSATNFQPDGLSYRAREQFDSGSENHKNSVELPSPNPKVSVKTPRGFTGYEGYYNDPFSNSMDSDNNGWSPFSSPGQKDTMFDSDSNIDWNVQKKDGSRQGNTKGDFQFQFPPAGPDYADMMMMMQIMKKMDSSPPKSGLLSRILDNPTALVMVTFIPISLLLAAVIPVVTNVMMNGVTIPPLIQSTAGKGRNLPDHIPAENPLPVLRSLIDFGSRYLDNPDCLHRIFCEMAKENNTDVSTPNYLRRAFDTATSIANDDLLETIGLKSFVKTIRNGKCDDLPCASMSEKSKSDLKDLMNDIMFKHSLNSKPRKR